MLGILVKCPSVSQQIACISGYGGQRCAKVMGNRAEQIGAKLLVAGVNCFLFFLLCVFFALHSERAFAENGKHNAVFKGIQRIIGDNNAYNSVNMIVDTNGKI